MEVKWLVIFNDCKTGSSLSENTYSKDGEGNHLRLESMVPRTGDYIVGGDLSSDINDKRCFIVKNVFWNLDRRDIEVYLYEVDRTVFPLYKSL